MRKRSFNFSELERLALKNATIGSVSGKLAEWPVLMKALEKAGCNLFGSVPGYVARELARLVLDLEEVLNEKNF